MANLTTLDAVKAFAGVTGSGDDSAINGIIAAVSSLLHGIVGQTFDGNAITGEFHPIPASTHIVLEQPAASIQAVREGTATLAASGYRHMGPGSRVIGREANGWPIKWSAPITVDYTPPTAVPADLELAAREAAAWVLKESALTAGASRLGLTAQANADSGNADYFVRRIEELPIVRAIIRRYGRFA